MKIIKANKITSITASSENPNFPATNLINGEIGKVFRSVVAAPAIATITLTIAIPAGVTNAIGIFGCNSTSIAYSIKDVTEVTTYFSGTLDTTPTSPDRTLDRAGVIWASNGFALHIILTLTAPTTATYHQVAEIVSGETITMPDPKYGLSEGTENYQIVQKLAGGGEYVFDGSIPRTFDLGFAAMNRKTEFGPLNDLYRVVGRKPVAMFISEFVGDLDWWGYFKMISAPKASHDYLTFSPATLSIEEAI